MGKLGVTIKNTSRLTNERCAYWATMAYWNSSEGIFLSMGIDPGGKTVEKVSDEKAMELSEEFESRFTKYRRFLELDLIPCLLIPSGEPDDDTKYIVYRPADFTKWAITNFSSFPHELHSALKEKFPAEFQDVEISKLNSVNETMQKHTQRSPTKDQNRSEIASDLANTRWSPKNKLEAQAEDYIRQEMQKGCNCNHIELTEYLPGAVDANNIYIFDLKNINEKTYTNSFRKVVRKVFKELAPDRIVGTDNYRKPQAPCNLHKQS